MPKAYLHLQPIAGICWGVLLFASSRLHAEHLGAKLLEGRGIPDLKGGDPGPAEAFGKPQLYQDPPGAHWKPSWVVWGSPARTPRQEGPGREPL